MSDNVFQQCMCQLHHQYVVNRFAMEIKTSIES